MEPEVKKEHKYLPILITVLVMILVTAVVAGGVWYYMDQQAKQTAEDNKAQVATLQKQIDELGKTTSTSSSSVYNTSNIFDINTVKVGDKVAGMTVTSVGKALPESSLPYGKENAKITFSGQANVEGSYEYTGNDVEAMFTDYLAFTVNPASFHAIPTISGDPRTGFSFTNSAVAKKLFGITAGKSSSGNATIVISDYKFVIFPGEGSNSANLVSISK